MSPCRVQAPIPPWAVTPTQPPGFRTLVDAGPIVYWQTGPGGRLVLTGGTWEAFSEGASGHGVHGDWWKAVVERDRKECSRVWRKAVREGRPLAFLFQMEGTAGQPRWIRCRATPVHGVDGAYLHLAGSFEDITHEMDSARALLEGWAVTLNLLDLSPLPTSVVSMETGKVVYSNHAMTELLGIPEPLDKELDPKSFYVDPKDLLSLQTQVVVKGLVEDFECRMKTQGGAVFWASLNARRISFHGQPMRIVTIRDINQSKAMLDRLAESERRFRNLFEQHAAIMLLIRPQDGQILDANPSACRFYGYPIEELRGMSIDRINVLPPGVLAEEMKRALTQKVNHFTFPHRLATGEKRVVEVESVPIELDGSIALFSIVHDVTVRRIAEEALKQSEMVLKQAQELGGMGHFILDLGTGAVEASAMLNQILNLPEGGPKTLDTLRSAIHPAFLQEFLGPQARDAGVEDLHSEFSLRSDDPRQIRWVQVRAHMEISGGGRVAKVLGTVLDITQRRRQEMIGIEMESQVAKGRMAAYIAHEINGPLAGIKNAFLLVESALPPDHPDRQYAELIKVEIKRISTIVKMLYELHKPVDPNPVDVAVGTVIRDIRTLLSSYARTRRVELLQTEGGFDGMARLNISAFRQLLYNLIQNAIEASPAGGKVTCDAQIAKGRVRIRISDEGAGVPEELADRIWDAGFTTKEVSPQGGLGLGLATCMRLVTCMGGSLEFKNGPEGGCTFTARIPEASASSPGTPSQWTK